jgi:starch-binding outer membrane protein, SusD/RagB family
MDRWRKREFLIIKRQNMNLKSIFITAAFSLFFMGCTEDFINHQPIALDTEISFYDSFEKLDLTATAAYGMLCSRDIYDVFYTIGYGSAAADDSEAGGENVNDWPQIQRFDRMTHSANETGVDAIWAYPYKGIRMTNEFLERVDDILEIDPKVNRNLVNQRVAEMKFLRAFFHFTLVQIYGGVPIADKTVDPAMFATPRNSIKEVLDFIQKDLTEAIPHLQTRSQVAPNYGRATIGAAQSLLAKAYLYESSYAKNYPGDERFAGCQQKWDLALTNAEAVIQSNEYELVGINGERFPSWWDPMNGVGGYRHIFTLNGDNSRESVFEIQNVMDGKGWTATRGTYITTYTTARYFVLPNGSTGTVGGWSFNAPTRYLMEAFGNTDNRYSSLSAQSADPAADPRFSVTIAREGDTILVDNSWYPISFINLPTGMIGRKYELSTDEYWGVRTNDNEGPMNIRLIRFADVVLMAAEAAFELGQNGKALDYVNQVRKRARMSGDTGYPLDLTDINSIEDIAHERRIELALEGHRFFDLARMGLAERFIGGITLDALGDEFKVNFVKGKHEFWPIPTREIQLSQHALVQYPAWR